MLWELKRLWMHRALDLSSDPMGAADALIDMGGMGMRGKC